jgi:hypothetical protein
MTDSEKLKIVIQALEDIKDPITAFKRNLKEGDKFDGMMAIQLSNNANYLKEIAKTALMDINNE